MVECSGKNIVRDEVEEVKFAYNSKILSMKDLCRFGFEAIKKRVEKNNIEKEGKLFNLK